ncbi:MAG: ketoacyl-ACP synthase III [Cyclobacteriaceae bacterium]|nr:ketoacyl-ACP synthase III [Cyclobacteriaceae bacterium]MCB0498078.1 ketoacyl-ACP synthase III [Cyclobacteriaceae bacterium]MCB9238802.1 ketoacyl-ACP synthase III [Flammeovirgaceae bacterium]MCO5270521.1 ketoacyl-ACP synthase III [Cyclobacteriaceae bacterium]MCW5901038.1 ketoacyl-ACP synthase III [Cyclobacteriaceae bacterium]
MSNIKAAITGVGGYVPDYVLTNKELETMVETSDEWITTRTGIKERRILKGENLGVSYMGAMAVKEMLAKTNTDPKEIDLIIFATITPDMPFPAAANLVASQVGATNAFSFDVSAACSGFMYALTTGAKYIEAGMHKKVIVIGGDKMSSILDYTDRTTCIIFGDGAGCVLLEPSQDGNGILDSIHKSDGSGAQYLHIKAGGSLKPASHESVDAREHYVYQEGSAVFKFAVTNMADIAAKMMERNHLKSEDINWLAPHQANKRIIDATASRMGIPEKTVMMNIERYGNTTAGTIPLLLWDYEKQLKKGDNIIIAAFGGGFTWGSIYVKWAYDTK